jgi:beta-lactamase regulating signal transducer with metallopeptidase domain/predicted  nucleic acid-binding Zn-ribbon protein
VTASSSIDAAQALAVESTTRPGDQGPALTVLVAPRASFTLPPMRAMLVSIWVAGALAALVALAVALARVARLALSSRVLETQDWRETCTRIAEQLEFRKPVRVIASPAVITPMAGGIVRPTVFVPSNAETWDAERREIVLSHEIAHLASGDPMTKLLSHVVCALYWFHPLVWLAQREAAGDCERACDERVLSLGVRPSIYAQVLLDFADTAPARVAGAVVPIVRRSRLEARVMAILVSSPRPAVARRRLFPALGAAALTISLAAAQPAPAAPGRGAQSAPEPPPLSTSRTPPASEMGRVSAPASPALLPQAATPIAPAALRPVADCWDAGPDSRSFSGSLSMSGTTIHERIGWRGGDPVIEVQFGDLSACMIAETFDGDRDARPSEWIGSARRVVLETRRRNDVRAMEIDGGSITWTVNGQSRPVDEAAAQWRTALLAVLEPTWELSRLRGTVSSMRGEISSILGERSSLRGEISSLRGQVSSMKGEISSLRGHESSLRGEISSIRGHESSLRGMISSERGAISSLGASRSNSGLDRDEIAERIRRHENEISRIEAEITRYDADARVRAVEREIDLFDVESKVAAVERRIREFELDARVAAVEREIANLEVERRIAAIERDIDAVDLPGRTRELEGRRDAALAGLRRLLSG